jgi:hypothetical protein
VSLTPWLNHHKIFDTAVADVLFYSYIYLRHLGGFMGIFNPQIISRTQPLVIVSDLAKLKPLPLSGCSLKTTAPTYPFKRAALHSGYLGLLLICGVIKLRLTGLLLASTESQSFNHCGQYEVNLHSPNHLLCSIELPLRYYLSVGSLVSKKVAGDTGYAPILSDSKSDLLLLQSIPSYKMVGMENFAISTSCLQNRPSTFDITSR